jgi:predicted ArsR family transcriptional regulator
MAEEVGANYGRTLAVGLTGDDEGHPAAAGQRSLRSAMQAVAAALTAHGFAARAVDPASSEQPRLGADKLRIVSDHCPFGTLAIDHPVMCAVDRGLVRGMLTALYPAGGDLAVATESSKARGDTICATAV